MRSFEDRIAEISRRSENRIRARRKRHMHVLAACIPLVLCIGLYAVVVPHIVAPEASSASDHIMQWDQMSMESSGQAHAAGTATVTVTGNGIFVSYTASADVSRITGLLNGITFETDTDTDTMQDQAQDHWTGESQEKIGYSIAVTQADGTVTEYFLSGTTLTNRKMLQEYSMTKQELTTLKDALGLPLG